jgi:hypothetical protein
MNDEFNFKVYRKSLLQQLVDRNKRESYIYQDIVNDYKELFEKYKAVNDRNHTLDRELISLKKYSS